MRHNLKVTPCIRESRGCQAQLLQQVSDSLAVGEASLVGVILVGQLVQVWDEVELKNYCQVLWVEMV